MHFECVIQATAVTMTLVGRLEAAGGLEEWAVYVALHLQDSRRRSRVVTELLSRHAPAFAVDPSKRTFLLQVTPLPNKCICLVADTFIRLLNYPCTKHATSVQHMWESLL